MHSKQSNELAVKLCEAITGFAKNPEATAFNGVLNCHNDLLRSCGGKTGDDSRLVFKDLKAAVDSRKGIGQAAKVALQAFGHEFEAAHSVLNTLTETAKPEAKPESKPEPKKPDSKS